MIAHRIVELRYLICGSPSYLERRGQPKAARRRRQPRLHPLARRSRAAAHGPSSEGPRARHGSDFGRWLLISNFAAQREAAAGVGLAILPLISVGEDLEVGRD